MGNLYQKAIKVPPGLDELESVLKIRRLNTEPLGLASHSAVHFIFQAS